ncbi:MAG: valine--tRNA ligase [Patescibacteria group bacterium]|jgi:valyl-tRNA synthetase|nr:valine--tRNA ligase [Patescibacteria group bacterium]
MKKDLEKNYNPSKNEEEIYEKWEKSGFFNPDNLDLDENTDTYTIVLPPPNITAKLHLGHASTIAIEDLIIRYKRMSGYRALWLPGTDHASIATQNVVEKKLLKEKGITRHELGREKFLEEVWQFLRETQDTILYQIKKTGASLDWSRLAFTLDEKRQKAVRHMFKEMYDEGIIYQGERLVNWCPRCNSTLADDEIDHKEQNAKIYTFKYDKDFPISISTTRPETKLGDSAIAVNPKDERYKKYIGQELKANFCGIDLNIKVIEDYNVDMTFGTGALGVTPAHSAVDWQMAENNDLEIRKVIDENANILPGFKDFSGLHVLEARKKIIERLKEENILEKEEDLVNNLSTCYRCSASIEPLPSKQWFVSVDKKIERLGNKSLKEKTLEASKDLSIEFIPTRFKKRFEDWMENLHDWCISRQIWFGHQIPVWYKDDKVLVSEEEPQEEGWVQDLDTLDTWFSSGMWTFSTLGWPDNYINNEKSGDLKKFHPTQVLETGYEIITLWVSRMVMMSFFSLGEIPFEKVYLHGMILDKDGKKMSKSKGNGVDPIDTISSYGADATRLSLLMGSTPGNDVRFSEDKIEAKRNFVNKLWNISRYILSNIDNEKESNIKEQTLADKWILLSLNELITSITNRLDSFEFSLAAEELTDFTWNKLADWYLEVSKIEENKDDILIYILKNILILWHPFIPFVTEKIWESFNDSVLMVEKWPQIDEKIEIDKKNIKEDFNLIIDIVVAIRNLRTKNKIEPNLKIDAVIIARDKKKILEESKDLITNLKTNLKSLKIEEDVKLPENSVVDVVSGVELCLIFEVDSKKEVERLKKEVERLEKLIKVQKGKLDNKNFVEKAPEKIVNIEKEKLDNYLVELDKINKNLKEI